jgi:hypothetical protein
LFFKLGRRSKAKAWKMEREAKIDNRYGHRDTLRVIKSSSPKRVVLHPLQQLQQVFGNQAVEGLLRRTIQAKLAIGESTDVYEQQADPVIQIPESAASGDTLFAPRRGHSVSMNPMYTNRHIRQAANALSTRASVVAKKESGSIVARALDATSSPTPFSSATNCSNFA